MTNRDYFVDRCARTKQKNPYVPRVLSIEEIRQLLSVIDKESYTGFRDALIIQFLLDTMVRLSKLVAIFIAIAHQVR